MAARRSRTTRTDATRPGPTQKERPFQLAQAAVLVVFVAWGVLAGLRFHI
jgi:hypothetical protein